MTSTIIASTNTSTIVTATTDRMDQPAEVANKVLRRAQVSKMTRTLQNRLALANVKIKHGWESLSLDALEPRVDVELKRKRPGSSNETMSDASSVSERFYPTGVLDSSPLAAPIFSDELQRSGSRAGSRSGSSHGHNKRTRYNPSFNNYPGTSNHNRTKVRTSHTASASWKSMHRLPESSPVYARRHARFGTIHAPSLSFVSETSTVPDGSRSPILSEDDDEDLPITSFQLGNGSHLRSSPPRAPRTPPPAVARSARLRQSGFTAAAAAREGNPGQDEANLLMYLATSPSPARPGDSKPVMLAPSTPPPKQTPLPSSMMTTPRGGDATFPFGLSTPSTNLNFADFLNMTPSPAQATGSWGRTPAGGKTPAAAREARRRLNFDNIVPPTNETARTLKVEGLGMDLGGELVS